MIGREFSEDFLIAAGISSGDMDSSNTICWAEDFELLDEWLSQSTKHCQTQRVMRKEIERFLLWIISVRRKRLLELEATDISEYAKFLERPMPVSTWISKTKYPKCNAAWRPFAGPLNEASRRYALIQVGSFYKWALRGGLLEFDPTKGQKKIKIIKPVLKRSALAKDAVSALFEVIGGQKNIKKILRDYVLFSIVLQAGLLVSEILSVNIDDINRDDSGVCWITIRGKSGVLRRLAITTELFLLIDLYKAVFHIQAEWKKYDASPLVLPATGRLRRLHPSTILKIIKGIAEKAKILLQDRGRHEIALALCGANGYMLRHSCFANISTTSTVRELKRLTGRISLDVAEQYFYCAGDELHRKIVTSLPPVLK